MTIELFPVFPINLAEPEVKPGFQSSILHIFAKPALEPNVCRWPTLITVVGALRPHNTEPFVRTASQAL